jgi:hypothetical protein
MLFSPYLALVCCIIPSCVCLLFLHLSVFVFRSYLFSCLDTCIEALVVRGAIEMSRFLQGEPYEVFRWVEYDGSSSKQPVMGDQSPIIRHSNIFQRLVNTIYHGIIVGLSIYTIVDYSQNDCFWFEKHFLFGFQQFLTSPFGDPLQAILPASMFRLKK